MLSPASPDPTGPVQYSVHPPSAYIQQHSAQLLPDWPIAPQSVLIILQFTAIPLGTKQAVIAQQKNNLRSRFLAIAQRVQQDLAPLGWLCEGFDPQTGYPLRSRAGSQRLDDAAVVKACLGYAERWCDHCRIILHPDWADAVYPSVLLATAPPAALWLAADRRVAAGQPQACSV